MFTEPGKRMEEYSKNFSKEIEYIIKYQIEVTDLNNTVNKLKNTLEGFTNGLDEAEEEISRLKYVMKKLTQS